MYAMTSLLELASMSISDRRAASTRLLTNVMCWPLVIDQPWRDDAGEGRVLDQDVGRRDVPGTHVRGADVDEVSPNVVCGDVIEHDSGTADDVEGVLGLERRVVDAERSRVRGGSDHVDVAHDDVLVVAERPLRSRPVGIAAHRGTAVTTGRRPAQPVGLGEEGRAPAVDDDVLAVLEAEGALDAVARHRREHDRAPVGNSGEVRIERPGHVEVPGPVDRPGDRSDGRLGHRRRPRHGCRRSKREGHQNARRPQSHAGVSARASRGLTTRRANYRARQSFSTRPRLRRFRVSSTYRAESSTIRRSSES